MFVKPADSRPVLSLDIGGTKTLAALVQDGQVLEECVLPTQMNGDPQAWVDQAAQATQPWRGQYSRVAAAVSGWVSKGMWSPLNTRTLNFQQGFALQQCLSQTFECPAWAINDAQAAAWGEYRYGAARNQDMLFLTLSTGLGGGMVIHGQLHLGREGLAGHVGVTANPQSSNTTESHLEDTLSGRWMASQALALGHGALNAKQIFALADQGLPWAQTLTQQVAQKFAAVCAQLQWIIAPECVVVGGGIGLAPSFLPMVERCLGDVSQAWRPLLRPAVLGSRAGVIGVADHACMTQLSTVTETP